MRKWLTSVFLLAFLLFATLGCMMPIQIHAALFYGSYENKLSLIFLIFVLVCGFVFYRLKRALRKRTLGEKKAKRSHERLQRTMEELNTAIQKTADAHQIKSQFLANMSHELKTPMNTIIGMGELLVHKKLPEKEHRCLTKMVESAHHLMNIINDILDFSKIEANSMELKSVPFQLEKLVLSISEFFRLRAQQKGLDFLIDLSNTHAQRYRGDPKRLKQVLFNLLSNAVKFTNKGEILLKAKALQKEDGKQIVRFEIKDTGIGIQSDQAMNLFNAFSQADMSTTRHYEGVGLGLSIAQGLVLMMGGSIQCESVYGKGSTFWFEIPLPFDHSITLPKPSAKLSSLRILLVDTNETALEILAQILSDLGVLSITCKNVKEALTLLESHFHVNAVIMSYSSETPETLNLFHTIKHRFWNKIPSILLTHTHDKEALLSKLGTRKPYKILSKPITSSILLETLLELSEYSFIEKSLPKTASTVLHQLAVLKTIQDNTVKENMAYEIFEAEGIHTHYALEALGGKRSFYHELLNIFATEYTYFKQEYEALVLAKDTIAIKRMCHTLKGMSATLGMEDLCTLAQYAECLEHPLTHNSELLQEMASTIERYILMIRALHTALHVNQ
ncbi:ATP-binding protein [Sulfurospirillum barnesii]|uniref:histidine kinase n=1 Tax=Sulfurospirillum barnesii (strain ATCC 700032 / DSM 10660 / SES-3) TaxID=760154 RepID=I3XYL5_SULBS|nr:ATP-binding protein [Sulfurospirillum barnesii]AFL69039.1 signal transduction histidine kinase [Sulfurospirillum barnesii SES-3]